MIPYLAKLCLCTCHFHASVTQFWREVPCVQHCVCFVSAAIYVLRMAIQHHLCEKRRSFCAVPVDSVLTSIGCVGTSSLILGVIFSFATDSKQDKKSAVVSILPRMCAMVKSNCRTNSHAFQNGGGSNLVWKNFVTDLLSVLMITSFVEP